MTERTSEPKTDTLIDKILAHHESKSPEERQAWVAKRREEALAQGERPMDMDEMLLVDKLAKILQKRLAVEFHGWGEEPSFTCKNFYLNGHFGGHTYAGKSYLIRGTLEHLHIFTCLMTDHHLELIGAFLEDPSVPMPEWVPITFEKFTSDKCIECGEIQLLETDGQVIRLRGACKRPNGFPAWTTEIDCPSGKLVFNDDLREWFREAEKRISDQERVDHINISQHPGIYRTAYENALDGCFTGYVGNSNPRVWRVGESPNTLLIGNPGFELEEGADPDAKYPDYDYDKELNPPDTEKVAWIDTGLWWYSVADLDKLKSTVALVEHYEQTKPSGERWTQVPTPDHPIEGDIVEVEPGRYRCTHYMHQLDRDDCSRYQIYAKIERIGPMTGTSEQPPKLFP
jgi:hypothetical protein